MSDPVAEYALIRDIERAANYIWPYYNGKVHCLTAFYTEKQKCLGSVVVNRTQYGPSADSPHTVLQLSQIFWGNSRIDVLQSLLLELEMMQLPLLLPKHVHPGDEIKDNLEARGLNVSHW
jgi:hypothetical protein